MRTIGNILLTLSLVAGALSATVAYQVPLSRPDEHLLGRVLAAPAGKFDPAGDPALAERVNAIHAAIDAAKRREAVQLLPPRTPPAQDLPPVPEAETAPTGRQAVGARNRLRPLGRADDPLTPELLALLRDQGVKHVRVTSFSLGNWSLWWGFALSVVGLIAAALLIRAGDRRAPQAAPAGAPGVAADDPAATLDAARRAVADLQARLRTLPSQRERLRAIVETVGALQQHELAAFVAARAPLVARLGIAGHAQLMDAFAAGERQINRAWSAAADGHEPEAIDALHRALPLLDEASNRLRA